MGEYFTNFSFDFLMICAMLFFYFLFKFWHHGKYVHDKEKAASDTARAEHFRVLNRSVADY